MNFTQKVHSLCKKIPKGKVVTYKQVAQQLNTKAYRAVGSALNKNKDPKVPCHRVIKSNLEVGNYNKGTKQKIKLLKKENIKIIKNKIPKKYLFSFL